MFDLVLAIVFSAMIPVLLKYAHKKELSDEVILTFNYVIATIISISFVVVKRDEYQGVFNDFDTIRRLVIIGVVTGLMYYGAFYFYQKSVKDNGVSISIAVGKMGIVIPMILSLILWREFPSSIQWIGIVVSIIAIAIINVAPKDFAKTSLKTSLLLFFIIGGLGDFANKLFEVMVGSNSKDLFLAVVFLSALIVSLFRTVKFKAINKLSIIYGFAVGIPNMLTAYFLISALSKMNATVVFPMYSGGAIMLSMIWSLFAFKERLKAKEITGVLLIILALVLINF